MSMTISRTPMLALALISACNATSEKAEELKTTRYMVEFAIAFEETVFNTQMYDLSPRDERPQVIEPYQLGWFEIMSTTSPKPPGWGLSLEQVQAEGISYPDVHPAIMAYPNRVQKVVRRMALPGYVCARWRGLPSAEYEFLAVAVTSQCRPVPAELGELPFEEAKNYLPSGDEMLVLEDPFVIDIATVRSAFAAEGASNIDGWDKEYVGPNGETDGYY